MLAWLGSAVFFGGSLTELFSSFLPLSFCHRTNSDSALHTSAMSPNPQDPFGKNQQMGRGPPQRNGELGLLILLVLKAIVIAWHYSVVETEMQGVKWIVQCHHG